MSSAAVVVGALRVYLIGVHYNWILVIPVKYFVVILVAN